MNFANHQMLAQTVLASGTAAPNNTFTCMRELPLELQYYFLRGLPSDQQLFASMACREWYDMMAGHIHVSISALIRQDAYENFLFIIPTISSREELLLHVIDTACELNKINIITMLWLQRVRITSLECRYMSNFVNAGWHRVCPIHSAAMYCVKHNAADMLRMLSDICPHIYESDDCKWLPDDEPQPAELILAAATHQSTSVILYLLTTPLAEYYILENVAWYAKQRGKNIAHMCIKHHLATNRYSAGPITDASSDV